ncbi:MAG: hypothetical protein NC548_27250 [Lachnospiraceae bacterium]|nr:hypothetical protein [Lachnospiraceae bacterium]
MTKTVFLVYQDCYKHGVCEEWYKQQKKAAKDSHIKISPLPYSYSGAKEIILDAAEQGITLPFFAEGKKYSKNIQDFIKPKKSAKKKEVADGVDTAA